MLLSRGPVKIISSLKIYLIMTLKRKHKKGLGTSHSRAYLAYAAKCCSIPIERGRDRDREKRHRNKPERYLAPHTMQGYREKVLKEEALTRLNLLPRPRASNSRPLTNTCGL